MEKVIKIAHVHDLIRLLPEGLNTVSRRVRHTSFRRPKGRTFIMIAHRLSIVKQYNINYLLKDGNLISERSYDQQAKKTKS